jgi:hypothetical protein
MSINVTTTLTPTTAAIDIESLAQNYYIQFAHERYEYWKGDCVWGYKKRNGKWWQELIQERRKDIQTEIT